MSETMRLVYQQTNANVKFSPLPPRGSGSLSLLCPAISGNSLRADSSAVSSAQLS